MKNTTITPAYAKAFSEKLGLKVELSLSSAPAHIFNAVHTIQTKRERQTCSRNFTGKQQTSEPITFSLSTRSKRYKGSSSRKKAIPISNTAPCIIQGTLPDSPHHLLDCTRYLTQPNPSSSTGQRKWPFSTTVSHSDLKKHATNFPSRGGAGGGGADAISSFC